MRCEQKREMEMERSCVVLRRKVGAMGWRVMALFSEKEDKADMQMGLMTPRNRGRAREKRNLQILCFRMCFCETKSSDEGRGLVRRGPARRSTQIRTTRLPLSSLDANQPIYKIGRDRPGSASMISRIGFMCIGEKAATSLQPRATGLLQYRTIWGAEGVDVRG